MEIEPPNLNIPLERKERWGLLCVGVCCAVTGLATIFSPSFATVFAASSMVVLPALLLLVFPSPVSARFCAWGYLGRIAVFAIFIGYVALSKKVIVPFVISVIEHALF